MMVRKLSGMGTGLVLVKMGGKCGDVTILVNSSEKGTPYSDKGWHCLALKRHI